MKERDVIASIVSVSAMVLVTSSVAYFFLRQRGVNVSKSPIGAALFSLVALLAIGSIMYFSLRWRGIEVSRNPIGAALVGMAVNFATGVFLTLVTGDKDSLWSFGKAAILAGPLLFGIVWLMRRYALK